MAYLVLDLGTSGLKAFVLDDDGKIISYSKKRWKIIMDEDEIGTMEYNADYARNSLLDIIKSVIKKAKMKIKAITVSAQRVATVFLDKRGDVLYIGPNSDARGIYLDFQLEEEEDLELYKETGHLPYFLFAPARLIWFKERRKRQYDRIYKILTLHDWVIYELTGEIISEPSIAADIGLINIHKRDWSRKVLEIFELEYDLLPELKKPGDFVGYLKEDLASTLGLNNIAVYVGSGDTYLGLLATNAVNSGDIGIIAGYTAPVMQVIDRVKIDPEARMWCSPYLYHDKWVIESNAGNAGGVVDWFVNHFLNGDYSFYRDLIKKSSVGSNQTYLIGIPTIMDFKNLLEQSNKIRIETLSPIIPYMKKTNISDFARAIIEAIAYAIRANLEQILEISEIGIKHIGLTGGVTKFEIFPEILVNVLGRDIMMTKEANGSVFGCYLLLKERIEKVSINDLIKENMILIKPSEEIIHEYNLHYESWLEAYKQFVKS